MGACAGLLANATIVKLDALEQLRRGSVLLFCNKLSSCDLLDRRFHVTVLFACPACDCYPAFTYLGMNTYGPDSWTVDSGRFDKTTNGGLGCVVLNAPCLFYHS